MQVTGLWIPRYGSKRLSVGPRSSKASRNLRLTALLFFSLKRSSSPTLRFFAHKQTLSSPQPVPLCKWEIRSNLQTTHTTSLCELWHHCPWGPGVTLTSALGIRKFRILLGILMLAFGLAFGPGWISYGSLCEDCVLLLQKVRSDILVQYAACRTSSS